MVSALLCYMCHNFNGTYSGSSIPGSPTNTTLFEGRFFVETILIGESGDDGDDGENGDYAPLSSLTSLISFIVIYTLPMRVSHAEIANRIKKSARCRSTEQNRIK